MPKKRPPHEVRLELRRIVWNRDKRICTRCNTPVLLATSDKRVLAQCDHRISGKKGTNKIRDMRTLCYPCHVLRADLRHRGMIAAALRDGIIPSNWRELVWEE